MLGMAQNKCQLPHEANMHSNHKVFGQKIIGVLEHGVEFVVYRAYDHMSSAASNLVT